MIETIRPTMSMVKDLLPGMKESWIFNDCAIGETRYGEFVGLVVIRICESNDHYYGFVPKITPKISRRATIDSLDIASEIFDHCPEVFDKKVTWDNIKEGHRYARGRTEGPIPRTVPDLQTRVHLQDVRARQRQRRADQGVPHMRPFRHGRLQRFRTG